MHSPISPSRSSSLDSYNTAAQFPDRISLRSLVSSDDGTVLSDSQSHGGSGKIMKLVDHSPPRSSEDLARSQHKSLPTLPQTRYFFEKERLPSSYEYDPYAVDHVKPRPPQIDLVKESMPPSVYPMTTTNQLASALGPDNAPYTTEIDSIPCAGVRIPHGPLFGLIAWRLVVRVPLTTKGTQEWWANSKDATLRTKKCRRTGSANALRDLPLPAHRPTHTHSFSDATLFDGYRKATMSAVSLPLPFYESTQTLAPSSHVNGRSMGPSPLSASASSSPTNPAACVTNFLLDTCLPHSIISRETLLTLGYPASQLPTSDLHSLHSDEDYPSVTLSVQGISTRLRIARPGEASRLGVQFLHDAGVSVFFPKNGQGVGPVLYRE